MAKIDEITLIKSTYETDSLRQRIQKETSRTVLCTIGSVSAQEFFEAGRAGLRPQFRAAVFAPDYDGEDTAEYHGIRYGIYRTYLAKADTIELYLERKAGA